MTSSANPPASSTVKRPVEILILTASHLCRNPRVVKEALTLGEAGYDVLVLSVSTHTRFEAIDLAMMHNAPFQREVLDHMGASFASRWPAFRQRAGTYVARQACRFFGWESARSLGPAHALLRAALRRPAALTIVHTEIPIWAARHLIRDGRRVAVDFEDWNSEDLLFNDRKSRPLKLLRASEKFALTNCIYATATSQAMAAGLNAAYGGQQPVILPNTFPRQNDFRPKRHFREKAPTFIWFSQTIGPGRGLELFFAAWAQMSIPSHVYLLGDGRPEFISRLLTLVPPMRRNFIHVLPPVSPDDLPGVLSEFDVGLALEPKIPRNRDLTITNKIFQYMNAGLALVASDTAGQREIMESVPKSGILVATHETTDFARQLDALVGHPERLKACQRAAQDAATNRFCWECGSVKLLEAVERSIGPPRNRSFALRTGNVGTLRSA